MLKGTLFLLLIKTTHKKVTASMNHLLSSHDCSHPVPIAYGPGQLVEIGEHCAALGISKPLIVTDKGSAALPFIKRTQLFLEDEGLASSVLSQISPNPRLMMGSH